MRKVIYVLVVLITAGILTYKYLYKEHRIIKDEKANFTIESINLIKEFSLNPKEASQKYLDKTIEVEGTITEISEVTILLDATILCYMIRPVDDGFELNAKITIKGRFIGYDELLEELKIDQVNIVE